MAIHWRYSHGDWFNHCERGRRKRNDEEQEDTCTLARVLMDEPERVADYLAEYVKMSHGRVKSIYFACPPTEMEFILKIRKI